MDVAFSLLLGEKKKGLGEGGSGVLPDGGLADDGKRCIFFKVRAGRCFVPCFLERRKRVRGLGEGGSAIDPGFESADDGKRCIFFKVQAVRCFVPCFLERRTGLGGWGKGAPRFSRNLTWRMTGSAKTL